MPTPKTVQVEGAHANLEELPAKAATGTAAKAAKVATGKTVTRELQRRLLTGPRRRS